MRVSSPVRLSRSGQRVVRGAADPPPRFRKAGGRTGQRLGVQASGGSPPPRRGGRSRGGGGLAGFREHPGHAFLPSRSAKGRFRPPRRRRSNHSGNYDRAASIRQPREGRTHLFIGETPRGRRRRDHDLRFQGREDPPRVRSGAASRPCRTSSSPTRDTAARRTTPTWSATT